MIMSSVYLTGGLPTGYSAVLGSHCTRFGQPSSLLAKCPPHFGIIDSLGDFAFLPVNEVLLSRIFQRLHGPHNMLLSDVAARVSIALDLESGGLQCAHAE